MDNRERDRVKQQTGSKEREREHDSGTSAELGQRTGRAENLSEGGEMRNKDNESNVNKNVGMGSEQSRRPESESYGSSPGRRSGMDTEKDTKIRDDQSPGRSGSLDKPEDRH